MQTKPTPPEAVPQGREFKPLRWRAIILGALLIPPNLYWLYQVEHVEFTNTPTTSALFFNSIFILLVLIALNAGIRRFAPRHEMSRGEMLVVYVMVTVACGIAGMDQLALLLVTLHYGFARATPDNGWLTNLMPNMPSHLLPANGSAIKDLYTGNSTLYMPEHYMAWIGPLCWWGLFSVVFMWVCFCMTSIFRRQWDNERLTYPMAEIPLQMSDPKTQIFKSKLFWLAFAIAASVRIWNLLALMYPSIPLLPVQVRAFTLGNDLPWVAAGPIPVCFFPFAVGMCFFLPTQISFSILFFMVFSRMEEVVVAAAGIDNWWQGAPYVFEQGGGAAIGLAIAVLWHARKHLKQVWLNAMGRIKMDDEQEPMPYRTAFWGFVLGSLFMVTFAVHAGMRLPTALIYFGIFLLFVLITARLRAEVGLPTLDIWMVGSDNVLRSIGGDSAWTRPELSVMTLFFWLTRAHRQLPMAIQADSLRLADRSDTTLRSMTTAILIASVLGVVFAFWIYLHTMYKVGYDTGHHAHSNVEFWGSQTWIRLNTWINSPQAPDMGKVGAYVFGAGFTMFLSFMRVRFGWWPLHPTGFLAGTCFGVMRFWLPMLFAASAKSFIMRFGGLRSYRAAVPFFIGLIAGEFAVGMLISILSCFMYFPPDSGIGGL